jgi:hypothetical protein
MVKQVDQFQKGATVSCVELRLLGYGWTLFFRFAFSPGLS